MGDLGAEDGSHRLGRRLGQLWARPGGEAARGRDPFAGQTGFLLDAQSVGHIVRDFVGAPACGPIPILHEGESEFSGHGCPIFASMTRVWVTISGWISQLGMTAERTSARLSANSRRVQPGNSRSSHHTHAGKGTTLYFPLTPRSAHRVANLRTNASGISTGQSRHGLR